MGSFQKITYLIGSTLDQSYDRQLDGMKFDKVFEEKKSVVESRKTSFK